MRYDRGAVLAETIEAIFLAIAELSTNGSIPCAGGRVR